MCFNGDRIDASCKTRGFLRLVGGVSRLDWMAGWSGPGERLNDFDKPCPLTGIALKKKTPLKGSRVTKIPYF